MSSKTERYPAEDISKDEFGYELDNGTMPENVEALRAAVIGHRIVKAERKLFTSSSGWHTVEGLVLTLDNGKQVTLEDTSDCCAYTYVQNFLLNPELVDHIITGVGTTDGYQTWHIYADLGDVLSLSVNWSAGNPFYYGYGFEILVEEIGQGEAA